MNNRNVESILEGLRVQRVEEKAELSVEQGIKTMKTNLKGIQSKLDKGDTNVLTVKSTLDMCKNMDKAYKTDLFKYYKKDLNGVADTDSERLLDVWKQAISELEKMKRGSVKEGKVNESGSDVLSQIGEKALEKFCNEICKKDRKIKANKSVLGEVLIKMVLKEFPGIWYDEEDLLYIMDDMMAQNGVEILYEED